jgi:hypothetical protein
MRTIGNNIELYIGNLGKYILAALILNPIMLLCNKNIGTDGNLCYFCDPKTSNFVKIISQLLFAQK